MNDCESIACPINYHSEKGVFPCTHCPNDKFTPYLGYNGDCLLVHEKLILDSLYAENYGGQWANAERWGNPNVPHCMYEGVDCNEDGNVVNITLSGMNLQGKIPGKLGRLAHLRRLKLDNNLLTGAVPSDLRFPPLEELDLSNNHLVGPLPPLLCEKEGINGNGDKGVMSCDAIVCAEGTWHVNGNAHSGCLPCPRGHFLGQTGCSGMAAASGRANEYLSTHSWPILLVLLLIALILTIVSVYVSTFRQTQKSMDESSPMIMDSDVYDANNEDSVVYDANQEELTVMSYPSQAAAPPSVPIAPPSSTAVTRRGRTSPDDDPDTQDLWLDVPKIA